MQNMDNDAARVIRDITKTPIYVPEGKGEINVCEAVKDMINESRLEGRAEGKAEGKIEGTINTYRRFHVSKKETKENLIKEFLLSEIEAEKYMNKFWD